MSSYRIKAIKNRNRAKSEKVDLSGHSFAKLRSLASARGLFRVGMSKADLIRVLS